MERKIPVPGSFYRHFKGSVYQIREIATHSETGEKMVVYQAMYPPFGIWVRPLGMFMEQVDRGKYPKAQQRYRFEEVYLKPVPFQQDQVIQQGQPFQQDQVIQQGQPLQQGQVIQQGQPFQQGQVIQQGQPLQQGQVIQQGQPFQQGQPAQQGQPMWSELQSQPAPPVQMAGGTVGHGDAFSDEGLKQILINGQAEKLLEGRLPDEEIARRGFLVLLDAEKMREKRQIFISLRPYLKEIHLSNIAVALDLVLEEGSAEEHYEAILHCLETFERYEGGRLRQ